jgi:hypothetical protein
MPAAAAPVLPSKDVALDTLFQGVHQRTYFAKLASFGYVPRTQAQAQSLLDLAGRVDLIDQESTVKAAMVADDPFGAACAQLDQVMNEAGHQPFQKAAEQQELWAAQQTAEQLMQDPTFYNAMLMAKKAEAEEHAQRLLNQGR